MTKIKKENKMYKPFPIISVCREDLVGEEGWKKQYPKKFIDSLTDSDMKYIAGQMANSFCDMDTYWEALDDVCDYLLKKYKKKTISNKMSVEAFEAGLGKTL